MKALVLTLSTLLTLPVFALDKITADKIDALILKMETVNSPSLSLPAVKTQIDSQASSLHASEAKLWNSIIAAYDFLKLNDQNQRYIFMYKAIETLASGRDRIGALKRWSGEAKKSVAALKLSPRFHNVFKIRMEQVDEALADYDQALKGFGANLSVPSSIDPQFISQLASELKEIKLSAPSEKPEVPTPIKAPLKLAHRTKPAARSPQNFGILSVGLLLAAALGFALGKKGQKQVSLPQEPIVLPPLPIEEEFNALPEKQVQMVSVPEEPKSSPEPIIEAPVKTNYPAVSLEEKCEASLQENAHLFKVANINIYPYSRSPFSTHIHAPEESVAESVDWLLKGAIAIAKSHGSGSHDLEWNCKEQFGRVSLEIILHGIECDSKSLYKNAVMDKEASAPAHFGRSEMALYGHLPSVRLKSGHKRTTISFGLESSPGEITH